MPLLDHSPKICSESSDRVFVEHPRADQNRIAARIPPGSISPDRVSGKARTSASGTARPRWVAMLWQVAICSLPAQHAARQSPPAGRPREQMDFPMTRTRPRWSLSPSSAGCGRYCQLNGEETTSSSGSSRLACKHGTSDITPSGEGAIAGSAVLAGRQTMTAELEVVVDRSVSGEKLLGVPG